MSVAPGRMGRRLLALAMAALAGGTAPTHSAWQFPAEALADIDAVPASADTREEVKVIPSALETRAAPQNRGQANPEPPRKADAADTRPSLTPAAATDAAGSSKLADEKRKPNGAESVRCSREAVRTTKPRAKRHKKAIDDAPCARAEAPSARGRSIENSEVAHNVSATIENLTFENGEVPHARVALERIKKDLARCAESASGAANGTVEFRFIVRAPGRAEGVDVTRIRGVSSNIVRCATSALMLRSVGSPSADPVGVIMIVRFGNT
jgi:hypothetical protein